MAKSSKLEQSRRPVVGAIRLPTSERGSTFHRRLKRRLWKPGARILATVAEREYPESPLKGLGNLLRTLLEGLIGKATETKESEIAFICFAEHHALTDCRMTEPRRT